MKINLYFENNGITNLADNRTPFLNAIPSEHVSKSVLNNKTDISIIEMPESYFAMSSKTFYSNFNSNYKISKEEKFYYPIIFNTTNLINYVDTLAVPKIIIRLTLKGFCKILIVCPSEGWPWETYNILIDSLITRYKLKYTDFVILTAKLNDHPKCKVVYYNFWEMRSTIRNYEKDLELGKKSVFNHMCRPYKFICLNRRAIWHRFSVISKLWEIREQGLLSFWKEGFFQDDFNYAIEQKKQFILNTPNLAKIWELNKIDDYMPLYLPEHYDLFKSNNIEKSSCPLWLNKYVTHDPYTKKFFDSYLHIVTETLITDEGFFSEKIFKPIIYCQPFILIGQYKGLEYLKKIGYKTFSNVIDESYDLEKDNEKRIIMATDSAIEFVKKIDNNLMIELWHIFEHNLKVFFNRSINIIDNLKKEL